MFEFSLALAITNLVIKRNMTYYEIATLVLSAILSVVAISALVYWKGAFYWIHKEYLIFSICSLSSHLFYFYSDKVAFKQPTAMWLYYNQPAGKMSAWFLVAAVVLLAGYSI